MSTAKAADDAVFNVVLYRPEIPPNTGNVIRLCANIGAPLHLVEPLGFSMQDRDLRRAGLDYHEFTTVRIHADLQALHRALPRARTLAFSSHARRCFSSIEYRHGDLLLFGPESRGLPRALLDGLPREHLLRIPMRAGLRSLNLSNAVAVASYEAWRQLHYPGAACVVPAC